MTKLKVPRRVHLSKSRVMVGLQCHKLHLVGTDVMHLNRACTYSDLSNLFVGFDVTAAAGAIANRVPRWLAGQRRDLLRYGGRGTWGLVNVLSRLKENGRC